MSIVISIALPLTPWGYPPINIGKRAVATSGVQGLPDPALRGELAQEMAEGNFPALQSCGRDTEAPTVWAGASLVLVQLRPSACNGGDLTEASGKRRQRQPEDVAEECPRHRVTLRPIPALRQ